MQRGQPQAAGTDTRSRTNLLQFPAPPKAQTQTLAVNSLPSTAGARSLSSTLPARR